MLMGLAESNPMISRIRPKLPTAALAILITTRINAIVTAEAANGCD
jgi:hypothetical protein